jgi:MSHA biogenesis protein MshQ
MSLFSRCALLVAALLSADLALAETYIFRSNNDTPSGNPSICSGDWDRSGSVFTCSGSISLAAGDVLRVRTTGGEWLTDITVVAAANLRLISNTVGTSAKNISLQTSYGTLTATGSNSIFGSVVSSSGAIDLAGATITGSVTGGSSAVRLSGGSVAGSVLTGGNITTDGTTISGSLTSNSGTVSLTGGSVTGQVRSGCCGVTTNGTDLLGGARSDSSSISITGGTLQGDFFANNNTATFTGVTMTAGTVSGASSVTFNNSMLGSTSENVTVTSVSGPVNLNNTVAYGDFTAPNYSTIFVNSPSTVTGTCLPNSTPANACRPGAVLSWSLDETAWSGAAGEVLDASGNSLNGTAINGAATASTTPALSPVNAQGTCGYGSFNATSNQYVQRTDNNLLDQQGSFSVGLWVRPRTLPASGLMTILSKDENYEFHLNPNGTINWWWQTTGPAATREFNSTQALAVGQWSHVLIRYAPNDQRIYINGALAGQATFSGTPVINGDPLQLGADQGTAGRYFNGELDELRIYNSALSQAQITALVAERHQCALALQCFNDNFNDGSLGDDWAVASRGATAFTPTVSGQRMRLTSNQGNVATSSTLQRLFPAAGNYIQVQFKHYAYNGSGADGVALVLSDAAVTPQPGAFGGPLGYGTRGDAANPGFAGGWLGIGIDEFGNFSTEGGPGGPGRRLDSVAIRGSGGAGWTSGYQYIAGTDANLNPGIDNAASTSAAPGHTYRITLDGRFSNEARVTVERDTGNGFVVLPNLNAVNVRAAANSQAPLPAEFYLSLTGSTGGSTNIHELDDLQVCATNINPIGQQIDHFELSYSGTALTCNPQPVTIRACLNSDCSSLYTNAVSVTLSPANYWTATAPAEASGNIITFSGGTAQAQLRVPTASTVTLDDLGSVPATKPNSQPVCSTAGCQISYAASGLLLQVPNMLAAKPTAATLSAVRSSDDALQCVPAFDDVDRIVQFTSAYDDPDSGSQPVLVNGSAVRGTATDVSLHFDATGTAPLTVRYDDAGRMNLSASYAGSDATGDVGLLLAGEDQFVSKPYGLCLSTESTCGSADADCAVFPGGIRAGDAFPLTIRAVGWESDDEASTAQALCSGNITTPNFRHSGITLSSAVQAPAGGEPGDVTPDSYDHALGNQTDVDVAISEVGVFNLSATPVATYFGETVGGGSRDLVGRFIPAYLGVVGDASLTPSCGSAFSYQGQPMDFASDREPSLTITAYNRAGVVTTNYDRGAFWKLAAPGVGSYSSITGVAGRDARLASEGTAVLEVAGADDGDGARIYSWTGEQLLYQPALLPGGDDYPFTAKVRQSFSAASLQETDQGQVVCYATGTDCIGYSYDFADDPGSEVRLGRLWIGNAHGSELIGLSLPVRLESWQSTAGGSFQPEGLDTCTTASVLGAPVLGDYSGGLAEGETAASLNWPLTVNDRSVSLTAPGSGNAGSVTVSFPLAPAWLQYPWNGVSRSAAKGLASFGIYKGAAPLIFRRELYR